MSAEPPQAVLEAFRVTEVPHRLLGGQGTTYRAGSIILKPIGDSDEATWLAQLFEAIPEAGFRVARPLPSTDGGWIVHGWSAFQFVEGVEIRGRWSDKIAVSRLFHRALLRFAKPHHIATAYHPWAIADRFAWGEAMVTYDRRLAPALRTLFGLLQPVSLPSQLIHGDITGNILFHDPLAPAVIDMAPYWRPAEFATAIIVVDSVVWEGADDSIVDEFVGIDAQYQLLVRATIRRLMELDGMYKQLGIACFDQVEAYEPLLDVLSIQSRRT